MKEEEAKTKWCPYARAGVYAGTGGISVNRHCTDGDKEPLLRDETRCIGSACMAWRWTYAPREEDVAAITKARLRMPAIAIKTDEGYCGLAGKS